MTAAPDSELNLRAQELLEEVINIGYIRDRIFSFITDRKHLKQLMTLNSDFMPSVAKALWSTSSRDRIEGLGKICSSVCVLRCPLLVYLNTC
jgi:hypothetical protein